MEVAPLLSSIVSLAAALLLLRGYVREGGVARLIFALAMVDMLAGQVLEFYASVGEWCDLLYKIYYFTSPLSPMLGGLGVLALLRDRRPLKALTVYAAVVTVILAYSVAAAAIDYSKLALGPFVGGEAMEAGVRRLSPLLTIPGGLAMIAGGAYTYWRVRAAANLLIVAGAILFMVAGALLRMGQAELFLWLELVATLMLAYAFVRSRAE